MALVALYSLAQPSLSAIIKLTLLVGSLLLLSYIDIKFDVMESRLWLERGASSEGNFSVFIFNPVNWLEIDTIPDSEAALDIGVTAVDATEFAVGGAGRFFNVRIDFDDPLEGVADDGTDLVGSCRSFSSSLPIVCALETSCDGNDNLGGLRLPLLASGGLNIDAMSA